MYKLFQGFFSDRPIPCIYRPERQGYLVVISTKMSEVGEEKFNGLFHEDGLTDVAYSTVLGYAAVAGTSGIKVGRMF